MSPSRRAASSDAARERLAGGRVGLAAVDGAQQHGPAAQRLEVVGVHQPLHPAQPPPRRRDVPEADAVEEEEVHRGDRRVDGVGPRGGSPRRRAPAAGPSRRSRPARGGPRRGRRAPRATPGARARPRTPPVPPPSRRPRGRPGPSRAVLRDRRSRGDRMLRAMSRLSVVGSLPVPVSPEEAWASWSRVEDWPRWDWMGSASARWLEGEPWAPGSRLRVGHRPFAFDCLLVESRPPEAVTWASRGRASTPCTPGASCPIRGGASWRCPRTSTAAAPG